MTPGVLTGKVQNQPYMVMSPYPGLDQPISLQSWGHQLKLSDVERSAHRPVHRGAAAQPVRLPGARRELHRARRAQLLPGQPAAVRPAAGTGHPRCGAGDDSGLAGHPRRPAVDGVEPRCAVRHPGLGYGRFIAIGVALGLLLIGAAGGLLLGLPGAAAPPVPAADSVDVGFAQDMTVHHQQAVEMASWERDHTSDPVLKQLAADIEATQTAQIGRMQGWLELWGAAALPFGGHMAWMTDPAAHDSHPAASGARRCPGWRARRS